ncbi:ATP-binding protein [Benzoatithermus flavus]|uniref:histidine kinase n=1 Tax=Benzoatithermus flavus TaxID=3108223 RepID=A0ABU8XXH5_9PROT
MRLPSLCIRNRIALLVTGIVCGLTMALLMLVHLGLLPEVRRQADQRLRDAMHYAALDLARGVEDKLADIVRIARSAPVLETADDRTIQRRWLASFMAGRNGYVWLGVAGPDGTVRLDTTGLMEGRRLEGGGWFERAVRAPEIDDVPEAAILDALPKAQDGKPLQLLRLSAPVLDPQGRLRGVLLAYLDDAHLEDLVRDLTTRVETEVGARLSVIDRSGRTRFGEPLPSWLQSTMAGSRDDDAVDSDPTGRDHAVLRVPVPAIQGIDLGWTVVLESDLAAVAGPLRRLETFLIVIGGLAVLITLLFTLPVATAITRPIDVLVDAAEAYAAGRSVPALPVARCPPEVGRLAHALQALVAVLQRRQGLLVQALAAGRQIAWEYDVPRGRTRIEGLEGTWLGWTAAELDEGTGSDWLAFVHADGRTWVEAAMAGFIASGDDRIILQYRMLAKDGNYRWVEDHALVLEQDSEGRALRLAGTVVDIDEHKAIEQRLRESEARATLQLSELQALYDQAPIGLAVLDPQFRYLRINPHLARINGRAPRDHIGRTVEEILPDGWPALEPLLRRVLDTGNASRALELTFETPAAPGVQQTFVASYFPIKDPSGTTIAVGAVVEDVTQRKRAEAAERAKSAFLATMSHEIRTPLTAILGFADLLADTDLGEGQRHQVAIIRDTGRMLLAIINDILDFSKLEAGKASLEIAPFALRELISGTFETARLLGAERGLAFRLEIGDGVPDRVAGDAIRLKQILTNLLGNAAKFTERGGITLRATLIGEEEDKLRLRFEIEDTGIGIAPERLPKLFVMFEQADQSITRRFGGTGLGLAICKRLADLMGGRIGARSTPGVGSTFWVELPFARVLAPARAEAEPVRPAAGGAPLRRGRILVVDDIATNRLLLDALLRGQGQEVVLAADGVEAVELAARESFDLILMDVHMPRQDGLAATRAIRASDGPNAATPIVALTAAVLAEEVAACSEAGMDDCLAKPVDPARLMGLLASRIGLRTAA